MSSAATPGTGDHPPRSPRATAGVAVLLLLGWIASVPGLLLRPSATPVVSRDAHLRLDPNTASRSELSLLPGLGPVRSARIVAYRQRAGRWPAFGQPGDLAQVRGIGPVTVARLRPHLRFDASAAGGPRRSP